MVVVPILFSFIFFGRFLKKNAAAEFQNQAARAAVGVTEELRRRSDDLLRLAEEYSKDAAIISAAGNGDHRAAEDRLVELYRYSALDLMEVGDARGRVLARGHRPGDYGENKASQLIIRNALAGKAGADIEYGASGIALRAVSPIERPDGKPFATLMTGVLLNKDFFNIYKTVTGFDMALYENGVAIANTSRNVLPWKPPGAPREGNIVFPLAGLEMWGVYIPVYHMTGEFLGSLLAWKSRDEILRPLRLNQLTLTFTFGVALVLAVALAMFLSRNFSAPLKKLLPIMDRVSKGKMDIAIPESKWKEFQDLSMHFRDMLTELKVSQEKISKAQRQLVVAGKLAVLGQVTAELAHEVRNPLNCMEINVGLVKEMLGDGGCPPAEIKEKVEHVRSEIKRLKQTIREFVQAGENISLRLTPLHVQDEMRDILKLAAPQIELLGVRLRASFHEGDLIKIDKNRFHQAVLNVILNACQSMKPGGKLDIRTEDTGERASIIIKDTGVGIAPEEREKIFNFPFSGKSDGTGCGLAYVLKIMQAHKGDFDIESEPGAGTTVTLSFYRRK